MLRLALIASLVLAATGARAEDRDTWDELLEPHRDEVQAIVERAQGLMAEAAGYDPQENDPAGGQRQRRFDDAFGMLRYARRLAPHNPTVLLLLGRAADGSGRVTAAIEALEAYGREVPQPAPDALLRLGKLHLQAGDPVRAARLLRQVRADTSGGAGLIHLAAALTASGRTDDVAPTLARIADAPSMSPAEQPVLWLALAVAYDRDEQLSAAFHAVDQLQSALGGEYGRQLQLLLTPMDFVPALDRRYYQAFVYETAGYLPEARAEWLNYAAAGPAAPFRGRALAHVAAIDRMLAEALALRARVHAEARRHPPTPPARPRPSP